MANSFTYKLLNQLLVDLGFERGDLTEKNHRLWRHPESSCTLLLPDNKMTEAPRPADLIGVKAQLDLHGHLDEQAFESFAAAGKLPVRATGQ